MSAEKEAKELQSKNFSLFSCLSDAVTGEALCAPAALAKAPQFRGRFDHIDLLLPVLRRHLSAAVQQSTSCINEARRFLLLAEQLWKPAGIPVSGPFPKCFPCPFGREQTLPLFLRQVIAHGKEAVGKVHVLHDCVSRYHLHIHIGEVPYPLDAISAQFFRHFESLR